MNFWKSDSREDMYKLHPLTKEIITYTEKLFDVVLPDEYIQILSIQNYLSECAEGNNQGMKMIFIQC